MVIPFYPLEGTKNMSLIDKGYIFFCLKRSHSMHFVN